MDSRFDDFRDALESDDSDKVNQAIEEVAEVDADG
jgi:ABC-type transporter Mla subunit MlaD